MKLATFKLSDAQSRSAPPAESSHVEAPLIYYSRGSWKMIAAIALVVGGPWALPQAAWADACCLQGLCVDISAVACGTQGGVFFPGMTCFDPEVEEQCMLDFSACCLPDGSCQLQASPAACDLVGGVFHPGDSCQEVICPIPNPPSCCLPDGTCESMILPATCLDLGGQLERFSCNAPLFECPPTVCCFPCDGCQELTAVECEAAGGIHQGFGSCDDPGICSDLTTNGACCFPDGTCAQSGNIVCEAVKGGIFYPGQFCCEIEPCPTTVCCFPCDGCQELTAVECEAAGGIHQGFGSCDDPGVCSDLTTPGSCCFPDGTCAQSGNIVCELIEGGTFYPGQFCCEIEPCPTTVCCFDESCQCEEGLTERDCVSRGGEFHPEGACGTGICFPTGACCLPGEYCFDGVAACNCDVAAGELFYVGDACSQHFGDCSAPIVAFGLPHTPLGQATLDPSGGSLFVGNIGSSGQDGVRVGLGQGAEFVCVGFEIPFGLGPDCGPGLPPGLLMTAQNERGAAVAATEFTCEAGGLGVSATIQDVESFTLQVYEDGLLVSETKGVQASSVIILEPLCPEPPCDIIVIWDFAHTRPGAGNQLGFAGKFSEVVEVQSERGFGPIGVGNEIRLIAEFDGPAQSVSLTDLAVVLANVASLEITEEALGQFDNPHQIIGPGIMQSAPGQDIDNSILVDKTILGNPQPFGVDLVMEYGQVNSSETVLGLIITTLTDANAPQGSRIDYGNVLLASGLEIPLATARHIKAGPDSATLIFDYTAMEPLLAGPVTAQYFDEQGQMILQLPVPDFILMEDVKEVNPNIVIVKDYYEVDSRGNETYYIQFCTLGSAMFDSVRLCIPVVSLPIGYWDAQLCSRVVGRGPLLHFAVIDEQPILLTTCPGDTNGDGEVNVTDLVNVIADWGTDGSANDGDLTGDGVVNVSDLIEVIKNWGAC